MYVRVCMRVGGGVGRGLSGGPSPYYCERQLRMGRRQERWLARY